VPMATYSEGTYKGIMDDVPIGKFSLYRKIRLPRYLGKGDYVLEFEVNHKQNGIHRFLWAKRCANIHVDGSTNQFGSPLISRWEGFLGLESY
jgi:lipopolysaccharide transport system ATP-binding protein